MSRLTLALLVLFASSLLVSCCARADDRAAPDPRLQQKVSIDYTNGRLYGAMEQISTQARVAIRAGNGAADWRVRDIPVLVCARDLPLGTLLRSIVNSSHLYISSSSIDGEKKYRMWRDLGLQRELAALAEWEKLADVVPVGYEWELIAQAATLPDSAFKTDPESQTAKAVSNLLYQLGPQVRDSLLSGQRVVLTPKQMPDGLRPYVETALVSHFKSMNIAQEDIEGKLAKAWIEVQPNDRALRIDVYAPEAGKAYFYVNVWRAIRDAGAYDIPCPKGFEGLPVDRQAKTTPTQGFPPPKQVVPPKPNVDDEVSQQYTKLSLSETDLPFLDAKVNVGDSESESKITYAGLLSALSKKSGYSIVAEAFACRPIGDPVRGEVTMRQALGQARGMDWYLDKDNKVILGRDKEWIKRIWSMVPEKLLAGLSGKLNGPGVELDDLECLMGLTLDQISEWVAMCPEFPEVQGLRSAARHLKRSPWGVYYSLSPQQRPAARAGKAVAIGCDPAWLGGLLNERFNNTTLESLLRGTELPELPAVNGRLLEAESVPELRVWVTRVQHQIPATEYKGKQMKPRKANIHTLHIQVLGDGEPEEIKDELQLPPFGGRD